LSRKRKLKLEPYPIEIAMRGAEIIGPSSSFAQALAELARRREAGERVDLFRCRTPDMLVVGPASDE
jgi:hypothetical protein